MRLRTRTSDHSARLRPSARRLAAAAVTALAVAGGGVGVAAASGSWGGPPVPAPPSQPTRADQIQNIDQVKTAIEAYYGDRADPDTVDPVTGAKDLHTFDPDGAYAHEMAGIVRNATHYLGAAANGRGDRHGHRPAAKKAVLFDVDDTLLTTYNYEIYSNFVYDPTSNAAFVNAGVFPATPHMVALEKYAESKGYTVFFLTGRPETQRTGTVANLTDVGYDVDNSNLYLKDYTVDTWLSSCAPSCTTIQYKSLTRAHIQSLGYRIVANLGDQYSDLSGGYAQKTVKLPNPMYYLP